MACWAEPAGMVVDWLTACYSKDCSMRSCLSNLRLAGLSDLSCQKHLVHQGVHLKHDSNRRSNSITVSFYNSSFKSVPYHIWYAKPLNYQHDQNFLKNWFLYNLLNAFCHLIDSLYFLASKHTFSTFSSCVFLLWNHYRYWNIVSNNLILDWITLGSLDYPYIFFLEKPC